MRYILSEAVNDSTVEVCKVNDSVILPPQRTCYATEALALEVARKYNFMYFIDKACQHMQGAQGDTIRDCVFFAEGEFNLLSVQRRKGVYGRKG